MSLKNNEVSASDLAKVINARIQALRIRCERAKANIGVDYSDVIALPHNVTALKTVVLRASDAGVTSAMWGRIWVENFSQTPSDTWSNHSADFSALKTAANTLLTFIVANADQIPHSMDSVGNRIYDIDIPAGAKTQLLTLLDAVLDVFVDP